MNKEYIKINIYICKYYVPTMALRLSPRTSRNITDVLCYNEY